MPLILLVVLLVLLCTAIGVLLSNPTLGFVLGVVLAVFVAWANTSHHL